MKLRKVLYLFGTFLIFIIPALYFGGLFLIKHQANTFAKEATVTFQQNKTESLLMLIDSDKYSLEEKNKAIWALGVLKDKNALPKLEMLYTGEDCKHDEALCQYELKKAILKINNQYSGSWQANRR